MPNRYFVRVVNAYSVTEHYVVADGHRDCGCMDVYFCKRAAIEKAAWRNLDSEQGLLKGTQFELLGTGGLLESSCLLTEVEVVEEVATATPSIDSLEPESMPVRSKTDGRAAIENSKANIERLKAEIVDQMMRRKLVP